MEESKVPSHTAQTATFSSDDERHMQRALALARRGYGATSPNPLVGAVVVLEGKMIGQGWHQRAGTPHAEIHALEAARKKVPDLSRAILYVTLEPCSTIGRTPPCTEAILASGIRQVIVAATDPNPNHSGRGLRRLRRAGLSVRAGLLASEATRLNESFNHWIVQRTPLVTCKCAMSLDGKIATNSGESKWITGAKARAYGMRLRLGADGILAGINTILRDDPALTLRPVPGLKIPAWKELRRVVLDPEARLPRDARVLHEGKAETTVVVRRGAPEKRLAELRKRAPVLEAPVLRHGNALDLRWVMKQLGAAGITSLLVEGGGETHYYFLAQRLVHRICFFYAPIIITGRAAPKSVAGPATLARGKGLALKEVELTRLGADLLYTATVGKARA